MFVFDIEKYRKELIGKKITGLFHTDQGTGHELLPGLGNAFYFSCVFQVEGGATFDLSNESIDPWVSQEPLLPITHKQWQIEEELEFIGKRIVEIMQDEHLDIYLRLENDTLLYMTIDYGNALQVVHYQTVFDERGNLK